MNALSVHAPVLLVATPLLAAFVVPLVAKLGSTVRNAVVGVFTLLTASLAGLVAANVLAGSGAPSVYVFGANPLNLTLPSGMHVPIRILFEVDGMSAFMILITALVAVAATLYSFSYFKEHSGGEMYYPLLFLLLAAIFGMEETGDLFNFFVFLEIAGIAACGLIGFRPWRGRSQEAAFKTMALYTLSGLFVLIALGLLYGQHGGLNIAYLSSRVGAGMLDLVALGLLVVALGTKAGVAPMHMWALDAYGEAPAPISAVLVASSQASLYGLFRVLFTLFGAAVSVAALGWFLIALSVLTLFVGVTMALLQKDIKRLIAYGAVSQIGYMLLGVGVGFTTSGSRPAYGFVAMQGGIFHMVNDAACIGLLFLAAGAVHRASGTRDLNRMGGLGHDMKWTAALFAIGALALAGVPPFNGFSSKLLIYESSFAASPILAAIAILSSILLLAVFMKVFQAAFLGPRLLENVREASRGMLVSMLMLAVVVVVFGLFPGFFVDKLVTPAAKALWLGRDAYVRAVLGG
ncbi:MAG: proton-conducting transporter membrane subunit [Candidatus Bipolaricaulota bacterium]|nr:proton-conducting transporter membrane subunit [Candidatus Bipolaricaulota bacterium]